MECYSQQTCTLFVDGELVVDEARRLREHLLARLAKNGARLVGNNRAINHEVQTVFAFLFRRWFPVHNRDHDRPATGSGFAGAFEQEAGFRLVRPIGDDAGERVLGPFLHGRKDVGADVGANARFAQGRRQGIGCFGILRKQ